MYQGKPCGDLGIVTLGCFWSYVKSGKILG